MCWHCSFGGAESPCGKNSVSFTKIMFAKFTTVKIPLPPSFQWFLTHVPQWPELQRLFIFTSPHLSDFSSPTIFRYFPPFQLDVQGEALGLANSLVSIDSRQSSTSTITYLLTYFTDPTTSLADFCSSDGLLFLLPHLPLLSQASSPFITLSN